MAQPCLIRTKYTSENARDLHVPESRNAALILMTVISFQLVSSSSPSFFPLSLPPRNPHYHLSCSMSWLIHFPSSCAPNAARANTCQEHSQALFFFAWAVWRDCRAWAAQAHLDRHQGRREVQPINVIPTAKAGLNRGREHYWGWRWK